jgi:hypothetical protein
VIAFGDEAFGQLLEFDEVRGGNSPRKN